MAGGTPQQKSRPTFPNGFKKATESAKTYIPKTHRGFLESAGSDWAGQDSRRAMPDWSHDLAGTPNNDNDGDNDYDCGQ